MEYRALIPRAPSVSWIKPAAATREPEFSIAHCLEMLENKELLVLARQATAAALRTAVHWEMTPPEILAALATREQRMEQQKQEYAQRLARLRRTIAWDDMPAEIHALILADMDLLTRARLRLTERTLLQRVPSLPYGWHALVPRNPRRFRELGVHSTPLASSRIPASYAAYAIVSSPRAIRSSSSGARSGASRRIALLWRSSTVIAYGRGCSTTGLTSLTGVTTCSSAHCSPRRLQSTFRIIQSCGRRCVTSSWIQAGLDNTCKWCSSIVPEPTVSPIEDDVACGAYSIVCQPCRVSVCAIAVFIWNRC